MQLHLKQLLFGSALVAVLALAFFSYLQPAFVLDLANRFILCF